MSWKDILKAPFDVQEFTETSQSPEALFEWADKNLDSPLQQAISENPNATDYKINLNREQVKELKQLIKNKPNHLELLANEYNGINRIKEQFHLSGKGTMIFSKPRNLTTL